MTRVFAAFLATVVNSASAQTVVLYSRVDESAAKHAHALAGLYSQSFIDRQLAVGMQWRISMAEKICNANTVLLVWSKHAAESNEVRREIDTALLCNRQVVPVMLDSTRLPGLLADVQAVDWRQSFAPTCQESH